MKLFDNKKTAKLSEKAAAGIANSIIRSQYWFAAKMKSLTKKWEQKERWGFLYLVCLFFGGASIIAVVNPFRAEGTGNFIISDTISTTQRIISRQKKGFRITKDELQKVKRYRSDHPNLPGEKPGLSDSLNLIEQIYYTQQK